MPTPPPPPPAGTRITVLERRVPFHETDAMGIVHHANYLHWFEEARVLWLEQHDQPYTRYIEADIHLAVTRVELEYHRSARFDDRVEVATWVEVIRGASLRMGYRVTRRGEPEEVLVTGATEHAAVDGQGRVRRLPKERRLNMQAKLGMRPEPGA